jgi:5-methylthioadenosine/S-adenosylhomocysteine deaminase
LQAVGVNITVGTDGAASNNNLDLLSEVQTAVLLAKGLSGDPGVFDAFAALELITINAARALRLEHEIGSLEVGKQADLAALDLSAPETQPVHNVISQVIYAASSRQFTDLWVAGRRLMDSGNLTTLDLASVLERAQSWQFKMADRSP